ncbi:hypothetical protein [Streptomyces violascens]
MSLPRAAVSGVFVAATTTRELTVVGVERMSRWHPTFEVSL